MSKKNAKKNNVIAADVEVAEEVIVNEVIEEVAVEEEPTVVTAEESAEEPEPEASAEVQIECETDAEHKVIVMDGDEKYIVTVKAKTRQDAKYMVYCKLDSFGPDARVPKFSVDKYLARKKAEAEGNGKKGKKGDGKKGTKHVHHVVFVDLDAKKPEVPEELAGKVEDVTAPDAMAAEVASLQMAQ